MYNQSSAIDCILHFFVAIWLRLESNSMQWHFSLPFNGPYLPSPLTRPPKAFLKLLHFSFSVMKKIRSGSYHNINESVKALRSNLLKPEILRPFSEFHGYVETWSRWNNDWMKSQRTFPMNPSLWEQRAWSENHYFSTEDCECTSAYCWLPRVKRWISNKKMSTSPETNRHLQRDHNSTVRVLEA